MYLKYFFIEVGTHIFQNLTLKIIKLMPFMIIKFVDNVLFLAFQSQY